jgi:uncharacterized membrane protein
MKTEVVPNECVVGVYKTLGQAEAALAALDREGLPPTNVSLIVFSPQEDVRAARAVQHGDKTTKSVVAGASAGGLLGLLVGATLLTIPGIGPILVAGAMAAGLTGVVVGGVLGCMAGWGVHEDHIRQYEEKVKEGNVLVIAHGDPRLVADAERVMQGTEAVEIELHAQTGDDSPEIDDSPFSSSKPR